jgi:hypothetical protein
MAVSRAVINFTFDCFAFLVLLTVLWTRMLTFVIVPAPAVGKPPVVLWGWTHAHWDFLNFLLTMFFALVVLVHLILHWTWVAQFVHQRYNRLTGSRAPLHSGTQTVYGVGFMIAVLTVAGGLLMVAAILARPVS